MSPCNNLASDSDDSLFMSRSYHVPDHRLMILTDQLIYASPETSIEEKYVQLKKINSFLLVMYMQLQLVLVQRQISRRFVQSLQTTAWSFRTEHIRFLPRN